MGQDHTKITQVECDESHMVQLRNILPVDVWCAILGYANNKGSCLQEYRVHAFVSKGFRMIGNKSVKKLNLIKLASNSPYRTCTLLAHIISEKILQQFPSLEKLSISFREINIYELNEKITGEDYKNRYLSDKLCDDKKLEELDNDLAAGVDTIYQILDPHYTSLNFADDMQKKYQILKGVWSGLRAMQKTDTPFFPGEKIRKTAELYHLLHKFIIEDTMSYLTGLKKLRIDACFSTNMQFIEKLPRLSSLYLSVYISKFSGTEPIISTHGTNPHLSLTHFESHFGQFDKELEWGILYPNLKSISLDMSDWLDTQSPNSVFNNIVKKLPNIEKMTIRGLSLYPEPDDRPFTCLKSLSRLHSLDISFISSISDSDLEDLCCIPNLRTLTMKRREARNIVEILNGYGDVTDKIKEKRPDIDIILSE